LFLPIASFISGICILFVLYNINKLIYTYKESVSHLR
jgi:hypothetical protein